MKKKKGFTLIELLVVITIIGVLAGIGASFFTSSGDSSYQKRERPCYCE
jgi:prepilin-type N-terminal cleavage/methylation domain-containing protein